MCACVRHTHSALARGARLRQRTTTASRADNARRRPAPSLPPSLPLSVARALARYSALAYDDLDWVLGARCGVRPGADLTVDEFLRANDECVVANRLATLFTASGGALMHSGVALHPHVHGAGGLDASAAGARPPRPAAPRPAARARGRARRRDGARRAGPAAAQALLRQLRHAVAAHQLQEGRRARVRQNARAAPPSGRTDEAELLGSPPLSVSGSLSLSLYLSLSISRSLSLSLSRYARVDLRCRARVLAGGRVPARALGIDVAAAARLAAVDLWSGDMIITRVDQSDAALDPLLGALARRGGRGRRRRARAALGSLAGRAPRQSATVGAAARRSRRCAAAWARPRRGSFNVAAASARPRSRSGRARRRGGKPGAGGGAGGGADGAGGGAGAWARRANHPRDRAAAAHRRQRARRLGR